jgi:hypothetical protein
MNEDVDIFDIEDKVGQELAILFKLFSLNNE